MNGWAVADDVANKVVRLGATTGMPLGELVHSDLVNLGAPIDCAPGPAMTVGGVTYASTVLVSDLRLRRVAAFDAATGGFLRVFIDNIDARGITRMPDGTYLVACGRAGVRKYTGNGAFVSTLIAPEAVFGPVNAWDVLHLPPAEAGGEGTLLVSDPTQDVIHRFSMVGTRQSTFAALSSFRFPAQLCRRSNGNVLVVDTFAHRILEFTGDGTLVRQLPVLRPRGIAELPGGDLLVSSEQGILRVEGRTWAAVARLVPGFPAGAYRFLAGLRCTSPFVIGDMNGDGEIDFFDIEPFIMALTDPMTYDATFPQVDRICTGDINGNGTLNNMDVQPFIELLLGS